MREAEPARDLERNLERLPHVELPLPDDVLLEVLAVDVLEDDVLPTILLAAIDDRDDVGVLELCGRAGLTLEALHEVSVRAVLLVEDLQRDVALEQRVPGLVDAGHPSVSNELLDLIALRDRLPDHGTKATQGSLAVFVGAARPARGRRTRCRTGG